MNEREQLENHREFLQMLLKICADMMQDDPLNDKWEELYVEIFEFLNPEQTNNFWV